MGEGGDEEHVVRVCRVGDGGGDAYIFVFKVAAADCIGKISVREHCCGCGRSLIIRTMTQAVQ